MTQVLSELTALSWEGLGLVALAITLAGILQGTTGIGYGLIAGPVLVLVEPSFVPGAVLVTGLCVTLLATLRERSKVNRSLLVSGIVGRAPGAVIGASLTAFLTPAWFGIAFGTLVLLAVFISVAAPRFKATSGSVIGAGVVSGVMGTITGVGAPPLAIVLQNQPGAEMRATLSAFLLFGAVLSILALVAFGRFGLTDLAHSVVLVPFCLLGFWLSGPLIALKALQAYLRPAVLAVCTCMSLLLLIRSFISLW